MRGEAGSEGGGVREDSFSFHSLERTRRAALINQPNSIPFSNVGLNFVPQGYRQAANLMGQKISEIVGYTGFLTGMEPIYIQQFTTRSQRHISSNHYLIYKCRLLS
jgi:hypothetical protein